MSVKDEVLKELENNKGDYISGGQLADNLGVSRNSVWKAIKALEKSGYEINAIPNKGYCLAEKNDILSSYSIKQHLKNPHLDISVFSSVTSTNTILKKMAEQGAKEGTVIIAEEQTAGRGRTGKQFYSPKGTGIYISILLRPDIPAEESLLTTSAAVATARAIEDVSDKRALIKWVNDIYLEDKKTCGILTEGAFNVETGKLDYAIVGIGINVCIPDGGFPDNIKDIATAIFDKQTDSINKRSILIANLLDYFMEYYKDFKSKSYVKEYIERSMIIGKTITVIEGSKTSVAKAIDIDKNCRLKVQFEDGTTKWLSSGEVSTKIHK